MYGTGTIPTGQDTTAAMVHPRGEDVVKASVHLGWFPPDDGPVDASGRNQDSSPSILIETSSVFSEGTLPVEDSVTDGAPLGLVIESVWSASLNEFENGLCAMDEPKPTHHNLKALWKQFAMHASAKCTVGVPSQWTLPRDGHDCQATSGVQRPKHTYQRRVPKRTMASTAVARSSDTAEDTGVLSTSSLGPVLEPVVGREPGKNLCLNIAFPSAPSFTFEESQTLLLMNLHEDTSEELDNVPTKDITSPERQSVRVRCDVCGRWCANGAMLKLHQKSHEPRQCELCGKLVQSRKLSCHRQKCRGEADKMPCSACGKLFASGKTLAHHRQAMHSNERDRRCRICSKTTATERGMILHMAIHRSKDPDEPGEPHQCHWCSRCFSDRAHLDYHVSTHVGIKKLRCAGCGKRFLYPTLMKLHKCKGPRAEFLTLSSVNL